MRRGRGGEGEGEREKERGTERDGLLAVDRQIERQG